MEESGSSRQKDAAPPWMPGEATAFRRFASAAASGRSLEASPSASGNGVAARVSRLHGVRRKPFVARLTADIIQTFEQCNPEFKYSEALNPKRFLTSPSTPAHNDGLDNANWDLILYVNLELVNKMSNRRFIVKEMLGQGTFGQVVKCWDTETNDYVAVKVIKNQPAFYHQAIMEVSLLRTLNQRFDPDDQHNIVRMLDYLSFQNHLCIAFEMLGQNLYELLKRNHLRGLKVIYVRAFSKQILDAMVVMRDAGIIHCDLKPENILLAPSVATAAAVKVIDFGSACLEGKTVYSYIQSRYYRSPEVLLGYPYTTAIDMWSFGCIVAELFIGLPLFPGASEYDVLLRMMKILGGQPPDDLLREAKNTGRFFKHVGSIYPGSEAPDGLASAYRMLSEEEVEARESKRPKVGKWYFPHLKLDKLIYTYPWNNTELTETEKTDRLALVDFLKGLLEFDPNKRWSPLQVLCHPFITGEPFTGPYEPVPETARIPVSRAAAIDHNPGGGHWLHTGLSPQVGSMNRCLPLNNAYPPKMPFSYGSSYGSFGSHGSYTGNAGLASSYGSIGDVNAINMYYSPLGSSGFKQVGSSPDIRLRPRLSHDRGIRLSPGSLGPMSLGASPSQFTPPNYQMQIPANSTGKHGSGSPASGGIHGSPLGKAAPAGPYSNRRNLPMPPHEYLSQHGQGRYGDGVSFSHYDAYVRGHTGYSQNAGPSSGHPSWRPQIGSWSGFSVEASPNHEPSHAFHSQAVHSHSFDFSPNTSAPSALDPADWDPNYSDESLLQEDNSLSADLSSSLHLGDAIGQANRSTRSANVQGHIFAVSNPLPTNQRADQLFHASSQGGSAHSSVPISFGGYNPSNYPQQNLRARHAPPFFQQRYNQATSSSNMRPMGNHHNGQSAWSSSYGMGDGVPWGGTGGHSFTASGLPHL
ncbi:dual specificity protein kinase YAK1 homolog isoform X2 [Phragmites australis]|uniref:dual specificity protein kinase YAK1 homolog isoform X2 n=1 Tax=Phragmites australis TaxID=29695 RepID=UPI002D77803F|nr:dual specificity protein kinase YAK1 homolog isoform X2 [Phragmites australis]